MFTFIKWIRPEGMGYCPCEVILKYNDQEFTLDISTGGCLIYDDDNYPDETIKGPWKINMDTWPENIPKKYQQIAELTINNNIPWGCCGACV